MLSHALHLDAEGFNYINPQTLVLFIKQVSCAGQRYFTLYKARNTRMRLSLTQAVRPHAISDLIRAAETMRIDRSAAAEQMPSAGSCERCGYITSQVCLSVYCLSPGKLCHDSYIPSKRHEFHSSGHLAEGVRLCKSSSLCCTSRAAWHACLWALKPDWRKDEVFSKLRKAWLASLASRV